VAKASKRTTSRDSLAKHERFEQISPEVGELDEQAFEEALREDADETLSLLAEMTSATDPALRELARRLAGRLSVDLSRRAGSSRRGVGRLTTRRMRDEVADIDMDASIDAIIGRDSGIGVDASEIRVRDWAKPTTTMCLVIDRSGSMGGRPLATAALFAASVAARQPDDYSVVMFSSDAVAVKSQGAPLSTEHVVGSVLSLRGHGTTDLAGALRAANEQLARSTATRKVTILLSDCRSTSTDGTVEMAAALDELFVVAPAGDHDEARKFAEQVGARFATIDGPSDVPRVFAQLID
jgi:Mg-chelatase subunit ChlD